MVRHIVLWSLEGNLTKQEKKETAEKIKELLEPIKEKVPGAVKVEVIINELDSSNRDVALISEFTDTEALAAYQVHPDHLAAKEYWIRGRQQSLPGLRVLRMVLVYGMVSEM